MFFLLYKHTDDGVLVGCVCFIYRKIELRYWLVHGNVKNERAYRGLSPQATFSIMLEKDGWNLALSVTIIITYVNFFKKSFYIYKFATSLNNQTIVKNVPTYIYTWQRPTRCTRLNIVFLANYCLYIFLCYCI